MVNFLFLLDTSYIMNSKVGEYGLTLLELCKTAIHRSVNNRRKSISKPTDTNNKFNHKYLLVTYSSTHSIQCGWDNSTDYFLKAIESIHATDTPNLGPSLSTAFRLLQSNPNQTLSYGQGWKSWQSEMNVIIILSYCTNDILSMAKRSLSGDELHSDWLRWNTRIFIGNINVFGTLHINHNPIRDTLNKLCLDTSPTDHNHVINNELHSLAQIERWVTAIMRDNSRDGVMVEFWDSSKEESKFNDGRIFREFLLPIHCDCKWPIPESYSPKEKAESPAAASRDRKNGHTHNIPARSCRPHIAISRTQKNSVCLPRTEWNVPYEQYEITSQRLREFVLNLPAGVCYYTYIQYSAGTKFNFAKPWGALKADNKRNKAYLYVFVYDFPFIWNQISVFLQAQKRNFHNFSHEEWKRAVAAYLNFIPCYYIQSVKELLMNTTKGVHLPSIPSVHVFDPSVVSFLSELQRKWRNNSDYKVKSIGDAHERKEDDVNRMDVDVVGDLDVNGIESESDGFQLNGFPFEQDNKCEDDLLFNAIYKHKHELNGDPLKDLSLPFIVNVRKRNWSTQNETNINQNNCDQRRKRRRLFHENMHKHNLTKSDLELMHGNIAELMRDLRLKVFGNEKKTKNKTNMQCNNMRTDSFDNFDTKLVEMEAENKLLTKFAKNVPDFDASNNFMGAFNESFIRNRVSVYGSNDFNSWKNNYKLIFSQKERDGQHVVLHNNMGNYTTYTEKLRVFKKDEFRNPFDTETEYNNYALSLSFVFLQERISKYKNKNIKCKSKSYLETESKLKSNQLLSIEEVLDIKRRTAQSIWTKNEICSKFYEEFDEKKGRDMAEYKHSLLKSPDWLSCQVLHNLKPTNLGGNPFKKRRKKSPFPSTVQPRNKINNNNNNKCAQLEKAKESQSKFEKEVALSLPHISGLMEHKNNNNKSDEDEKEKKIKMKAKSPSPPPLNLKQKKVVTKPVNIIKKDINKMGKPILPKPKIKTVKILRKPADVRKAIESAKNRQRKNVRQTQILPMKRKKSNDSHSNSNSLSSSPPILINEPATKKQKLSNGVAVKKKKKKKKVMQIVNTMAKEDNHIVMNGNNKFNVKNGYNMNMNNNNNRCKSSRQSTESQTVNILLFMEKYREMIRSQNKFDEVWFENAINCVRGLNQDTKINFYQLLINEANTYNRYELAQNIRKISSNSSNYS